MEALIATGQCRTKEDVFGLFHHLGFDKLHAAWVARSDAERWFEFDGGVIAFGSVKDGRRSFEIRAAGEAAINRVHRGLTDACTSQPALLLEWRCQIQYSSSSCL